MDTAIRKKIPIGTEDFEKIRTEGYFYVDKTALIRDLLWDGGAVTLFTRPRRFGKTLNMSMLKAFFEIGCDPQIFEGLEIAEEKELCEKYMGKYPVISITLKSVEGEFFADARSRLRSVIGKEALRFQFLLQSSQLTEYEKALYCQLIAPDTENKEIFAMSDAALSESLQTLSALLHKHYGQKAVVLIDEYDVPLAKASEHGYYDQMVLLIRSLFSQALKTNASLQFAVLTGCLRISKESIFTGLNNLKVYSLTSRRFSGYFGFTDQEVRSLLEYYNCTHCYDSVREWYDGYQFGNTKIYCPWDVLSYCDEYHGEGRERPQNYWINTSGNGIIRRFLEGADTGTTKYEMERLIAGEPIRKKIRQELTYRELYDSIENIWGVLFSTGYLTQQEDTDGDFLTLAIPNMEVRNIFTSQVMELFQENARKDGASLEAFCRAFQDGDTQEIEQRLRQYLQKTIGLRDTAQREDLRESFYHGILLGLLGYREDWIVLSNRESGEGYSDIQIQLEEEKTGIIIEVKYAAANQLETKCQEALAQIEARNYAQKLRGEGMQTILKYGIACRKKDCKVVLVKEDG